ncbi:hypothetical protein VTN77DRAFT_6268 [Rasamsonia byssochlamydoides]|uniref:uncharacterized protein n=1 Tax=Rasamsonia byssochlamydoides TaxID=89139 RepID=UPI0037449501
MAIRPFRLSHLSLRLTWRVGCYYLQSRYNAGTRKRLSWNGLDSQNHVAKDQSSDKTFRDRYLRIKTRSDQQRVLELSDFSRHFSVSVCSSSAWTLEIISPKTLIRITGSVSARKSQKHDSKKQCAATCRDSGGSLYGYIPDIKNILLRPFPPLGE